MLYQLAELLAFVVYWAQIKSCGEDEPEDPHLNRITEYRGRKSILAPIGSHWNDGTRKSFLTDLVGSPRLHQQHRPELKKKFKPIYIMIPTVFDISETMCSNIALTLLAASIT